MARLPFSQDENQPALQVGSECKTASMYIRHNNLGMFVTLSCTGNTTWIMKWVGLETSGWIPNITKLREEQFSVLNNK